jgi:hypothetical protein
VARVRALVARALVALVVIAGTAAADVVDLPNTRATVTVDAAWTPVTAPGLVAAYRTADGVVAAITRAQIPNPDAWRDKTRDAYVGEVERGVLGADLRRTAHDVTKLEGVPTLTLEARRPDGATVLVRILLFRTYALSLAIEVPRGAPAAAARALLASFVPPPATP